jgi:DNA-directed RNA polymerase specialized sigma24 family protein
MDDRLLVEALQSRDPDAVGAVYDSYAARLYGYCWFQLRGHDAAEVALRDTLIVAEAHIDRLRDPDRLGPWLYAIARLECCRRLPLPNQKPDMPIATHDQTDVDQRVMAWRAVMGLTPLSRELLELCERHRLADAELAAVVGLPVKNLAETLDEAHSELETALTAELLAHEGPYGCDGRAAVLRDRRGELTADLRGRLLLHARGCEVCGAYRQRAISAAKVYGMLPTALPPEELRTRVMSCFTDPELAGYRLLVATRTGELASSGFPRRPRGRLPAGGGPGATRDRRRRRWRTRTVVAVVALVAMGVVGSVLGSLVCERSRGVRTIASEGRATASARPGIVNAPSAPRSVGEGPGGVAGSSVPAAVPLGVRQSPAPGAAPQSPPIHVHQSWPGVPEGPGEPGGEPGGSPDPSPTVPSPTPTGSGQPPSSPPPDPSPPASDPAPPRSAPPVTPPTQDH